MTTTRTTRERGRAWRFIVARLDRTSYLGLHLTLGLVVLTVLWRMTKKAELTKHQWAFFEAGACFWHMVDLLWLVLFPLLFLAR